MLNDCLFCAIQAGEIPSTQVFADDRVVAFRDIAPRAPTHIVIIPRTHIGSAAELTDEHAELTGHMLAVAAEVARAAGIEEGGYRIVTNIGAFGGQTVGHLHFHLMGGRPFTWPPG